MARRVVTELNRYRWAENVGSMNAEKTLVISLKMDSILRLVDTHFNECQCLSVCDRSR